MYFLQLVYHSQQESVRPLHFEVLESVLVDAAGDAGGDDVVVAGGGGDQQPADL